MVTSQPKEDRAGVSADVLIGDDALVGLVLTRDAASGLTEEGLLARPPTKQPEQLEAVPSALLVDKAGVLMTQGGAAAKEGIVARGATATPDVLQVEAKLDLLVPIHAVVATTLPLVALGGGTRVVPVAVGMTIVRGTGLANFFNVGLMLPGATVRLTGVTAL